MAKTALSVWLSGVAALWPSLVARAAAVLKWRHRAAAFFAPKIVIFLIFGQTCGVVQLLSRFEALHVHPVGACGVHLGWRLMRQRPHVAEHFHGAI